MTKDIRFYNEAMVTLGVDADETQSPSGAIEACFTTWGAREGVDGRRFFYTSEPFEAWAIAQKEAGKPLPMYFQHDDEALPVGEWTEFMFDEKGMHGSGRLFLNTQAGRDIYTIMKESPALVGGVSVGAYADEYQMVNAEGVPYAAGTGDYKAYDEGYFQITKGGLREVSIVMTPNNLEANINKLESCVKDDGTIDPRDLEQALRDAGVSKQNAEAAVSVFKKVIERRDAVTKPIEIEPVRSDTDTEASEQEILAALEHREFLRMLDKRLKG